MLMNGSCAPPQSLPLHSLFSLHLSICLLDLCEAAERDFSTSVMKPPQGNSEEKLG